MQGPGRLFSKDVKIIPTKDREKNTAQRKKLNRQQDNNSIANVAVDEIFLHENKKVSAEKEAH